MWYEVHYSAFKSETFDDIQTARARAKELIAADFDDVYILKIEEVDNCG